MFSRRDVLAASAVGAAMTVSAASAASFGNPDEPPEGTINAKNPASVTDPGPQDPAIRDQLQSAFSPPPTDVGGMPQIWSSFNTVQRRIQNGGWARQLTQGDFAISTEVAGVNMRLTAGGIRELHWHKEAEWAYMIAGSCWVSVLDELGRLFIDDVLVGDLWYFPAGLPHSIQALADGCEFLLVFDSGDFSENETFLITDWFNHTPRDVLAKNFGVDESAFDNLPTNIGHTRYVFAGDIPPALTADAPPYPATQPPRSYTWHMHAQEPTKTPGGQVRITDSRNFTVSERIAGALVEIEPGAMRELHWH